MLSFHGTDRRHRVRYGAVEAGYLCKRPSLWRLPNEVSFPECEYVTAHTIPCTRPLDHPGFNMARRYGHALNHLDWNQNVVESVCFCCQRLLLEHWGFRQCFHFTQTIMTASLCFYSFDVRITSCEGIEAHVFSAHTVLHFNWLFFVSPYKLSIHIFSVRLCSTIPCRTFQLLR